MTLTKRVELLFDPQAYKRLEELAKSRNRSVANLIRSAVERQYLQPSLQEKLAAARAITSQEIDIGSWEAVEKSIEREIVKHVEAH